MRIATSRSNQFLNEGIQAMIVDYHVASSCSGCNLETLLAMAHNKVVGNDRREEAMECVLEVLSAAIATFLVGSFTAIDQFKGSLDDAAVQSRAAWRDTPKLVG